MKFNVYKGTTVGLSLLVVVTIFAHPFRGSAPEPSEMNFDAENAFVARAPASLPDAVPPITSPQFPVPRFQPFVPKPAAPDFKVDDASSAEASTPLVEAPPAIPATYRAPAPASSSQGRGVFGAPIAYANTSVIPPEKKTARDSERNTTTDLESVTQNNAAVGTYGGLDFATPAPALTGGSSDSDSVETPSIPQNVVASGQPGAVSLSWSAADHASLYVIDRSLAANGPFTQVANGISGTTYTDTDVINGVTYYYRVQALNSAGASISIVVQAMPSDLPTAPTLTVSAADGSASLMWSTSTGVGPITYSVERSTTSGSGFSLVTNNLSTTSFSDASLTDGTVYYYRVYASNVAGDSSDSNEVPAEPIAPFILGTVTASAESVELTWNPATGADSYNVKYGTASGSYTTTLTNRTSPATITGLTAGTTYYFAVQAKNTKNGLILSTNELSAIPLGPFSVTSLTATDIGQLKIEWSASTGATGYDVKCGTTSGSYTVTLSNQTSPATVTGLSNGTTYYCTVEAKNATGAFDAAEVSTDTMSLLTYTWPFDAGTDAQYSFDSSKLELVGGMSRLQNTTPKDASYVGDDFLAATLSGVKWDSANSKLVLDPSSDDGELNSQWTPKYEHVVGYWKLNGTLGSTIADGDVIPSVAGPEGHARNANDAGMQFVGGVQNQAITFDSDDAIELPTSNYTSGFSQFTISTWIKTSQSSDQAIFSRYQGGVCGRMLFGISPAGLVYFHDGGSNWVYSTSSVNDGQWHHLIYTADSVHGTIYIDGHADTTVSAVKWNSGCPNTPLLIGTALKVDGSQDRKFAGSIDEFAVFDASLDGTQVKTIYERERARYTGTVLSRVMNSGASTSWDGLGYLTTLPYGKELSADGEVSSDYAATHASKGLVGLWHMNDASGTTLIDSSGNQLNGTAIGSPTLGQSGKIGTAVAFDGSTHYEVPSNSSIDMQDQMTISAWIYRNVAGVQHSIFEKYDWTSGKGAYGLRITNTDLFHAAAINGTSSASCESTTPILAHQWYHVAATVNLTNHTIKCYVNGNLESTTDTTGVSALSSTLPLKIGARGNDNGSPFNGKMDEIGFWNRELSSDEIQALAQATQPLSVPLETKLVGLYHLNETSGTTVADDSGNGNDGTLSSSGVTLGKPGKLSKSALFSGEGSYIQLPATSTLIPSGSITLGGWFKTSSTYTTTDPDVGARIVTLFRSAGSSLFSIGFSGTGDDRLMVVANGSSALQVANTHFNDGAWHYLAATYDSVAHQIVLYYDGSAIGTASITLSTPSSDAAMIGDFYASSGGHFDGPIDEVGIWNRTLSADEIEQLYRRGANRVFLQARSCANSDCSDDPNGANWRGADGSASGYFSELNHTATGSPDFLFSDFGFSLTDEPYFQYRALLESDDASTSPDLTQVSAGPARYDGSNPTIIPVDGPNYAVYTGFTVTLGSACAATPRFQLSHDKKTWYYYASGMWNTASAGLTQASDASTVDAHIATLASIAGTGELYAKIFYPSDTTQACEIDSVAVQGADTSDHGTSNPDSFQVTSVTSGNGSATLTWDAASGATSYTVCYGTTQADADACTHSTTVTGTSTTISGLTNDTHYYFNVVATNASGVTLADLPTNTTPIASPSAPSSLVASAGIEVIHLSWSASSGSGSITYTVKRGTTSGGPYTTIAQGLTSPAYHDTSATPGTEYDYIVTAQNAGGTSTVSNEAHATALHLVHYTWTFDEGTDSSYSFDSSKMELKGGVCRLSNATPTDDSYSGNDFLAANLSGVKWDAANRALALDPLNDDGELNSNWTPQYDHLVGYWKLNGTAESTVAQGAVIPASFGPDGVFQNSNGSAAPTTEFSTGMQNQGIQFDGSDDYITVPKSTEYAFGDQDFSVSAWFKTMGTANSIIAADAGYGSANIGGWAVYVGPSGCVDTFLKNQIGGQINQQSNNCGYNDGVWHHVVTIIHTDTTVESNNTIRLFVDGQLSSHAISYPGTGAYYPPSSNYAFSIGARRVPLLPSDFFPGSIDEVAIWNTRLSDSEAQRLYQRQHARYTGTVLSRVMSSGAATSWEGLSYLTKLPYGKALPDNGTSDSITNYPKLDPNLYRGNVGLYHLDEASGSTTVVDASGMGNNGTVDTASHFSFGQIGEIAKAAKINSGQIKVNLPAGTFSSGVATFSFWMNWNGENSMPIGFYQYDLYLHSSSTSLAFNTFASDVYGTSATGLAHRWAHIVAEFHSNDYTQNKIYIDGVLQPLTQRIGAQATSKALLADTFAISGITSSTSSYRLNGTQIDELGVWNRALSADEVQKLYQHGSLMAGNVGFWRMDETAAGTAPGGKDLADDSGNGNHGVVTAPATLGATGEVGQAVSATLDGKIDFGTSSAFNTGAQLGFAGWIYVNDASAVNTVMNKEYAYEINAQNTFHYALQTPSPGWAWKDTGVSVPVHQWTHIAFTYDSTAPSNQVKFYLNGALAFQGTATGSLATPNNDFQLGSRQAYPGIDGLDGMLDEVGLWNRAITATEVAQLYQQGAQLMTGNIGLWHFDGNLNDSSGNSNTLTANSTSTLSTQGKFGSGSGVSDGNDLDGFSGTHLSAVTHAGTYSVSAWIYPQTNSGAGTIFQDGSDMNTDRNVISQNNDGICFGYYDSAWHGVFGNFVTQKWNHIVGVDNAGTFSLYVNGVKATGSCSPYGTIPLRIGGNTSAGHSGFNGMIDEVAVWSRPLSETDIQQLYQRGSNRILLQARSCANADCSDDPSGANWKGSDGTSASYFSEANNVTSGSANLTAPNFLFGDFGVSLTSNPYFQYRAVLESDNASLSPELTSVSAGPGRYDATSPTVIPINGPSYQILSSFTVTYGANGCSGTPKFQLSGDKSTWYYYSGGAWTAASNDVSQANDAATISSKIYALPSTLGTGTLYVKAFLPSDTTTACEIDAITLNGGDTNPTQSNNPNAFQITSVTTGDGTTTLNWSASTGATGYTVCYGTTQAQADACANQTTTTGTSTTISGLSNDTEYYFNVIGTTSDGRTPASVSVGVTPIAPPSTPTSLVATSGLYSANLSWAQATGDGVTYSVQRSTNSSTGFVTIASGLTQTQFTDYTALAGTTYYYQVIAVNAAGQATSNVATATALGSFNITAITGTNTVATVTWGSANGATSYDVKYGLTSNTYSTTLSNKTSPATISGLANGTLYYVLVQAKNSGGASVSSSEVQVKPLAPASPSASAALNQVTLTWSAVTGASQYAIRYGTSSGTYTTTLTNQTSPTTITGLTGGTAYYFVVDATNTLNGSSTSAEISATPTQNFTNFWNFTEGTDTSYSFDSSLVELKGGVCELKNFTPWDADDSAQGWGSASMSGVKWDSSLQRIVLDSSSDSGELSSSWTPEYASLVGYWKLNGTAGGSISDGTAIAAAIGTNGTFKNSNASTSPTTEYVNAQQKQGIQFDGVDDSVEIPYTSASQPSTSMSISAWFKIDVLPSAEQKIVGNTEGGGYAIGMTANSADYSCSAYHLCFFAYIGGAYHVASISSSEIPLGQWNHVVGIYDGSAIRLYFNGTDSGTTSDSVTGNMQYAYHNPLCIGSEPNSTACTTGWPFQGSIDDVAIWNMALSAQEVKILYEREHANLTGTLTSRVMDGGSGASWTGLNWKSGLPYGKELLSNATSDSTDYSDLLSSSDGLLGYWHMDETAAGTAPGGADLADASGNGNHAVEDHYATPTYHVDGHTGESVLFNKERFKVTLPANSLAHGTATVSMWVYWDGNSAQMPVGFNQYDLYFNNGDLGFNTASNELYGIAATGLDHRWVHLVAEFHTTDVTQNKLYVDGVLQTLSYQYGSSSNATNAALPNFINIGGWGGDSSHNFVGKIDEVALWNRSLSQSEVTSLYHSQATLMDGNIALYHMNEITTGTAPGGTDVADSSGNGLHGTLISPNAVGAPGKLNSGVTTAVSGGIDLGDSSVLNVGTQFGYAGWIYVNSFDSNSNGNILFCKESTYELNVYHTFRYALANTSPGWVWVDTGVSVPQRQWTHVAFTYDSTASSDQVKLYVNGVLAYSGTASGSIAFHTGSLQLGARPSLPGTTGLDGAFDEIGFWNRALTANEVNQLYRRAANRLKFQVRTCTTADCSDDPTGGNWKGPDGTGASYFSELDNTISGDVNPASAQLLYTNFPLGSLTSNRYFQYRALFESDDASTSPDLTRIEAGPARYDTHSSSISTVTGGANYLTLDGFSVHFGKDGCDGTPKYQLSNDQTNWYYWNGSAWTTGTASYSQANTDTEINAHIADLPAVIGTVTLSVQTFLPSNGTTACEIDQISVSGTR